MTMKIVAPTRVARVYTQHLSAPPDDVFPLLCPVREVEWAHDWEPSLVYSDSGIAEPDCVFLTPSDAGDEVWTITRHDPESWIIEMVMLAPGVVAMHISFVLLPEEGGCAASVRYVKTSLGPAGDQELARFTEEAWDKFMVTWEREVNAYLGSRNR
jgi:hypothetical protein